MRVDVELGVELDGGLGSRGNVSCAGFAGNTRNVRP